MDATPLPPEWFADLKPADGEWTPGQAKAKAIAMSRQADSTTHFGVLFGRGLPRHGGSRADQFLIFDSSSGTEVWSNDDLSHIAIGSPIKFKRGFSGTGIESVAVDVELIEPVAQIADAKIAKKK